MKCEKLIDRYEIFSSELYLSTKGPFHQSSVFYLEFLRRLGRCPSPSPNIFRLSYDQKSKILRGPLPTTGPSSPLPPHHVLNDLSPLTQIKYHCSHNLQLVISSKENNCTKEGLDSMVPPERILKFPFDKLSWPQQGGC